VVRVVDQPGLHLKLPFERVLPVDRRLLYSRPAEAEYLTADKKNVVVRSLAIWRIADPKRFLTRIAAGAYKEAAGLKDEGDAEAMRIYADAFGQVFSASASAIIRFESRSPSERYCLAILRRSAFMRSNTLCWLCPGSDSCRTATFRTSMP
jgi:regulator of protease activity HflC (stomatin/prohibitin superfamily)